MQNPFTSISGCTLVAGCLLMLASCQTPASRSGMTGRDTASAINTGNNTTMAANHAISIPDTTSLKGNWFLQEMAGSAVTNLKTIYIRFDTSKSSFTGSTGCNMMKGVFWYSDSDTSLVFGDHFLSTKMACTGDNEHTLLRSLISTNHYRLQNGRLTLLVDGHELSGWTRTPVTQRTAKL
jgi:heat shock protein HslJ